MKRFQSYIYKVVIAALAVFAMGSCTDLGENVYDQVMSGNYYQTRADVIHAVFRPHEHIFESVCAYFQNEELTGDQFVTISRGAYGWYDGGKWEDLHRHNYNEITDGVEWSKMWDSMYKGIGQCNLVLDDLSRLSPDHFGMTQVEWDALNSQLRTMRAYCYVVLLNHFRHCILTTTSNPDENMKPENRKQVDPEVLFNYIVSELNICLEQLETKTGDAGNSIRQGQFTKGAAAVLLMRLYLNAEVWIGKPMYAECRDLCKKIIAGDYGNYSLAEEWYQPFDWNNETCNEVIFAFPASYATTSWHMQNNYRTIYGRGMPYGSSKYFDIEGDGARNPKYALSPSYDNQLPRQLHPYKLGMVTQKFQKYPGDRRFMQYKNLSINSREGMFMLEGYIVCADGSKVKSQDGYEMYLLDQCGTFNSKAPEGKIDVSSKGASIMTNGDFNSCLYCVKYPFYSFNGGYFIESDCVQMRLAEVYYTQAECELRLNNASEAGKLLNKVRARNYTSFGNNIKYQPEGGVTLNMEEMLDEWGREFIMESRRRTDLIRFGRFQEAWWDKPQDADKHWELFPITQPALEQNPYLKQNPGYPTI